MEYIVYYKSTNGKNYFEKCQTSSRARAIMAVKNKYNDVAEIVEVKEN